MIFYFKYFGLFFVGLAIQITALSLMYSERITSLVLRGSACLTAIAMFVWVIFEWRKGKRSKVLLAISIIPAFFLLLLCGASAG